SVPFTAGGTDYLLLAFSAEHLAGEYRVVDHHAISWVAAAELPSLDLAPADIPIARELRQRSIDGSMGKASTEEQAQVRR
ncbi:MAG: hypothetical protein OEV91_07725, partial [Desulfobulbaceae bacterium]|nr:hypothetical protein [Desulfobulbaceae bacterium]